MVVKYKIHELAKDFNIKSNIVTDFFKSRGDDTKKSQTVLTSDELDLVFDHLTQLSAVEPKNKRKHTVLAFYEHLAVIFVYRTLDGAQAETVRVGIRL